MNRQRPPKVERMPGGKVRLRVDLCGDCASKLRARLKQDGQLTALAPGDLCVACRSQMPAERGR